ncbi:hypothetical protein [Natronococcus sp. JC468]|uniref:hypothetical protein n=1 Tax=Natronococcus sp. JC468 TaxID=1961921 RepID=UPI001FD84FA8|nr:hypothetical protein [Natronococcus sp. JC468]
MNEEPGRFTRLVRQSVNALLRRVIGVVLVPNVNADVEKLKAESVLAALVDDVSVLLEADQVFVYRALG